MTSVKQIVGVSYTKAFCGAAYPLLVLNKSASANRLNELFMLENLQEFGASLSYDVGSAVFLVAFHDIAALDEVAEYAFESGVGAKFAWCAVFKFCAAKRLLAKLLPHCF